MNASTNAGTLLSVILGICLLGGAAVILTAARISDGIELELSGADDESREYFV